MIEVKLNELAESYVLEHKILVHLQYEHNLRYVDSLYPFKPKDFKELLAYDATVDFLSKYYKKK